MDSEPATPLESEIKNNEQQLETPLNSLLVSPPNSHESIPIANTQTPSSELKQYFAQLPTSSRLEKKTSTRKRLNGIGESLTSSEAMERVKKGPRGEEKKRGRKARKKEKERREEKAERDEQRKEQEEEGYNY